MASSPFLPFQLAVNDRVIQHAKTFSDVKPGQCLWYENANGLVEIAVNQGSARVARVAMVALRADRRDRVLEDHLFLALVLEDDGELIAAEPGNRVGLTDGPLTGEYRVSLDGAVPPKSSTVSRADVAAFVLKSLETRGFLKRAVVVAD